MNRFPPARIQGLAKRYPHPFLRKVQIRALHVLPPSGEGVTFRRVDLPDVAPIPADARYAVLTERRTQLGEGAAALHTVEHVLAAVA